MEITIQYKIKNSPNDLKYLREQSYWYKYLNRSPDNLKLFENEMKKSYKITTEDRMKKMFDGLDAVSKVINILN